MTFSPDSADPQRPNETWTPATRPRGPTCSRWLAGEHVPRNLTAA